MKNCPQFDVTLILRFHSGTQIAVETEVTVPNFQVVRISQVYGRRGMVSLQAIKNAATAFY